MRFVFRVVVVALLGLHSLTAWHRLAHALAQSSIHSNVANRHSHQMRRILVTDDHGDLGQTICERLLSDHPNIRVVLAGRNRKALGTILDQVGDEYWTRLEHVHLDLDSDASVDLAAHELALHQDPIHAIIYAPTVTSGLFASKTFLCKAGTSSIITCEQHNPYLGLRRATRALLPLLQTTKGRWINVVSDEEDDGSRFCDQLSFESNVYEVLNGPKRTFCPSVVQAIVSQLDHVSQTHAPSTHENVVEFSQALVSTYSALLAKLQHPNGVCVQTVKGNDPEVIIDACMKNMENVQHKLMP